MKIKLNFIAFTIAVLCIVVCSCESTITEKSLTADTVILSAPVDNLNTSDSIPTFYWETLASATKYQLQIVSPIFDSIVKVYADTAIVQNLFPFALNKGKKYQWRVKAKNNSTESQYSQIRTITIQ